jgi:hypothetical protein
MSGTPALRPHRFGCGRHPRRRGRGTGLYLPYRRSLCLARAARQRPGTILS